MTWQRSISYVFFVTLLLIVVACPDDETTTSGASDASANDSTNDTQQSDTQLASDGSGNATLDQSFDGLYETVSYQKKQPCDAEFENRTIAQRYFRLEAIWVQEIPLLARYECTDTTVDSCSDTMSFFQSMIWDGERWMYQLNGATFLAACNLSITRGYPQATPDGFEIELTNRSTVLDDVSQDDCGIELASDVVFEEMDCGFVEQFVFLRL